MKGSKGDGVKQNQTKGASAAGETGPLFPRLHVNETEKAGPRAPPRNKMALYERFTVPSHRFVQPIRSSATTPNQPQEYGPNEYRYPYLPYYIPSSVPCANTNHGIHTIAQPPYGISSGGTSSGSAVVNDEEPDRVPRPQTVEKSAFSGVSRVVTKGGGGRTLRSIPEQKAKDATDLYVPTRSTCRVHDKESQKLFCTMPGGPQKHYDKFEMVKSVARMERPSITDITDSLLEALSTVEAGLECPLSEIQSCGPLRIAKSAEVNRSTYVTEGQLKRSAQQSAGEALDEQNEGGSLMSPVQSRQQSVFVNAGCQPESRIVCHGLPLHVYGTAEIGASSEYRASRESTIMTVEEESSFPSESLPVNESQTTFTNEENPGTSYFHNIKQKSSSPTDSEEGDVNAGGFPADSLVKSRDESTGESKNNQNGNSEVSEPSQHETGKGSGSDDSALSLLVSVSTQAIRPKDVIRAVGQQKFWKARKALLRQQRIFSDQVFQLHKLIKVQQLLAETPGTLIDEEMQLGEMEECDDAPLHCSLMERANYPDEKAHNTGSGLEGNNGQSLGAGAQRGINSCNPGWPQAVGNNGVGSNPSAPAFSPAGASAWGYPSVGLGQWMGPMAVQGGPFIYQPFAGTFPPGSSFGGPYGSAMLGPISPMVPFGIPYYDQRHEFLAEMSSNHGPSAVSNHQGVPAVGNNPSHMPNNPLGSWHFLQYNHLNHNQRLHATGSGKDVSAGSGASINNQHPATVHSMKTSCVPGIQYQWGMNSHTGLSNTNGLDSSGHQSENSSPSIATRSNCNTSASMPSTPASKKTAYSHQDEEGLAQHLDLADTYQSSNVNHCENGRRSVGREEADTRVPRWSKGQKEGGQVSISSGLLEGEINNDHSPPDYTGNALDLFPLMPSLTPDGWNGAKSARRAEEWQGRVIKAVPRPAVAASQSAAGILLSLQRERQQ